MRHCFTSYTAREGGGMIGLRASLSRPGHIRGRALEATSVTIMGQELAIPAGEFDVEYRGPRITTLANAFRDNLDSFERIEVELDAKECKSMSMFAGKFWNQTANETVKSLNVSALDTSSVASFYYAFADLVDAESIKIPKKMVTSNVYNITCCFFNDRKLKEFPDVSDWDVSNVIESGDVFYGCYRVTIPPDVSKWDVRKFRTCYVFFQGLRNIVQPPDIRNWKLESCTSLTMMFYGDNKMTSPDFSRWTFWKITDIGMMLFNCSSIDVLDFSSADFSKVTNVTNTFARCSSLTRIIGGMRNLKVSISFSDSPLTHDAAMEIMESLYDLAADGLEAQTLTLKASTKETLSDEEIASLATKGWTLA